jgi:cysteine desulfurase
MGEMKTRGFLDYQSGAPVDPRVVEAMLPYMTDHYGNAATFHAAGDAPREAIDHARDQVASLIGAEPFEIYFTSGATEANNMALKGAAMRLRKKGKHIVTSVIEHRSIISPLEFLEREGFEVTWLPVDAGGFVDPAAVEDAIRDETILVSIMMVNGEVGTIEPVAEIAEIAKKHNVLFHTDAVAALGWIPMDLSTLPFDLVTLSSNDIYGPKGMGALFIRKGVSIESVLHGGGHEKNMRSGTENVPGIVGFGKAAEILKAEMPADVERIKGYRDRLIDELMTGISDTTLNGPRERRVPNNANIRFAYIEGEALLLSLDMDGIRLSSGSACSAKTLEPSYVQLAMGIKHEAAHGSLQFTMGRWTSEEDIDHVIEVLPGIVNKLREMSALRPGMEYDKSRFGKHDPHGESDE